MGVISLVGGAILKMAEDKWTLNELLETSQVVGRALEALKNEHDVLLSRDTLDDEVGDDIGTI